MASSVSPRHMGACKKWRLAFCSGGECSSTLPDARKRDPGPRAMRVCPGPRITFRVCGEVDVTCIRSLTLHDRDDLALLHHLAHLHENRLDRAAALRRGADLHLHRFDQHDVLAGADLRTGLCGNGADATRDLGDDLLFRHSLPRLSQLRSTAIRQEKTKASRRTK